MLLVIRKQRLRTQNHELCFKSLVFASSTGAATRLVRFYLQIYGGARKNH